jgi:hypothetical protein
MERASPKGVLLAANVTEDRHMDNRDYDPATGRPVGYDPVTDPYAPRRRSSSALWGLLIAAIVAVAAVMFMYNSGDRDRTASNPAATTADRSNVPPAGPAGRATTGQSTGDLSGGAGAPTPPAPSTAR